jgi:hypothetical protein
MPYVYRGLGDLSTVANTIQTIEGWFPGSVSYRNNNPGNLKFAGQAGATGADSNGFAIFPDYQTGLAALDNQITLDASRGLTISAFTQKYAPASDSNDPTSYAAQIANASGLSVNDPLSLAVSNLPTLPGFDLASIFPSDPTGDYSYVWWGLGILAGAVVLKAIA